MLRLLRPRQRLGVGPRSAYTYAALGLALLLAVPAAAQTLSLSRSSGPSGTFVSATVSGFTPPYNTGIRIDGPVSPVIAACPFDVSENVRANCTLDLRIPAIPEGNGVVKFIAFNSIGETANSDFTVTHAHLSVRPTCAAAGLPVRVTGTGFAVGMSTGVYFDGAFTGASQIVPPSGQLDMSLVLPPVPNGRYTVLVFDSTYVRESRQIDVSSACAPVGQVTEIFGTPRAIAPDGTSRPLSVGGQVFKGEVIETDSNSGASVVFPDNTILVVAETSRFSLDEFVYDNATNEGSSFFGFLQGRFIYISGRIGKMETDNVGVETPLGYLGIRGTEFISIIDPQASTEVHHLSTGKLALTPRDRRLPPVYTGPVTITSNAVGSSAVLLDAATYTGLKANVLGRFDTDGDGVRNSGDLCPNTAPGATVDVRGCSSTQRDSDGDGVNDSIDQCPNTPTGSAVNAAGCAASQLDADADGVPNSLDLCPSTPAGVAVNAAGCAASQLDSDGDGVTDNLDTCPGTTPGTPVGSTGCAIPSPISKTCDVNGDKFVDSRDIGLILVAVGKPATGATDPRDANRNGKIDLIDAAICTKKCDRNFCLPPK